MGKSVLIASLLGLASMVPMYAQNDTITFNMGGGITTPLNPTGQYAGTSGNFVGDVGLRLSKKSSIIGEFMWAGLPPSLFALHPINAPDGNASLYALTANYRYDMDRIHGSRFGLYGIVGGGWYYRHVTIDKSYVVPPATVCQPIYNYWGYGCGTDNFVYTQTVASKGASAGGLNGGVGFTIALGDSPWKFYTEARYTYAFHPTVPSTLIPVTMGIRFN